MLVIPWFFVSLAVLLWTLNLWKNPKYANFPPGPRPWPVIGNILITGNAPHLALAKLSKKYGPIVGMTMGPDKTIFIHGAKLIREALSMNEFSGKFKRGASIFLNGHGYGIVNSEGRIWSEQRRFALKSLREFGFGKTCMEELIQENVADLIRWLKKQDGQQVSMLPRFRLAILNSLWEIVTGQRFHHEDSQLFEILQELDRTGNVLFNVGSMKGAILFWYPKIAAMFPKWSGWAHLEEEAKPREKLFESIIQHHAATRVNGEPRDFVDSYLTEIKKTTDEKSSFHPNVGYTNLASMMADLFIAGNDTTASSATWAIVYLYHYPEVQAKLQSELDRIIGPNRLPNLEDRKNIPYAEAVVNETLRIASITAVNLVHQSTADVVFHGYNIPKGTHIFGNLWESHHNPETWSDPEIFRPERFLSPDQTQLIKHEAFIPFSAGKRVCVGTPFATDSLFLFITHLVHTFSICPPHDPGLVSLKVNHNGLTQAPLKSTVVLKARVRDGDDLPTGKMTPGNNLYQG